MLKFPFCLLYIGTVQFEMEQHRNRTPAQQASGGVRIRHCLLTVQNSGVKPSDRTTALTGSVIPSNSLLRY